MEAYYCFIAEEEVVDAVHGAVGRGFGRECVGCGYFVFGKAGFPGKAFRIFSAMAHPLGPIHRSQVKPVIRPVELLLKIGIDELREKDAVKGGVLTDEDSRSALDVVSLQ